MDASSTETARDSDPDAPRGLWSDFPLEAIEETMPPPIPAAALKAPRVPDFGMTLAKLPELPEEEAPEEEVADPLAKPDDTALTTAELAFRVEPVVGALETAAPPMVSAPPKRLRPIATKRPKGLKNPWEPNSIAPPQPAAAERGPDLRSGAMGFALGLAVAAAVAFSIWPQRQAMPLVEAPEPAVEAPGAQLAEPALEMAELEMPMLEQSAIEEQPEPIAELIVEQPTLTIIDTVSASEGTEDRAVREARRQRREDRRAAAAAAAPATRDEAVADDEPVIAAEPTPAPRPVEAAPDPNRPAAPTREDVATAIQSIQAQLRECAPAHRGHVANVRFTFVSSGRASSAMVPHDFTGPAERSCVARAARSAHVPAFSDARISVTYPVQF